MNGIQLFSEFPFVQALGWTILHSIWQGALVAVGLALLLSLTQKEKAELRYGFAVMALALMLFWSGNTYLKFIDAPAPGSLMDPAMASWAGSADAYPMLLSTEALPESPLAYWGYQIEANVHWIFGLWLAGFIAFSLRWAGSILYVHRLRRRHAYPLGGPLLEQVQQLATRLDIRRPVALLESLRIQAPMVIGHLKPAILVPAGMMTGLAPAQVEAILVHELAHIQRHDYLVNLLQSLVEVLFFYHPAYWWIATQIRDEREHCCDDVAVSVCGSALAYARALTELEAQCMQASGLAVGLMGRKKHLLSRIRRIVAPDTQKSGLPGRIFSFSLLLAGLLCVAWLSPREVSLAEPDMHEWETAAFPDFSEWESALEEEIFEWSIAGVDTPPPPPLPPLPPLSEMPGVPPVPAFPEMPPFPEMPAFPGALTDSAAFKAWQEQVRQYQENYLQKRQQWQEQQQQWRQQYQEQFHGQMDRYREQMAQFQLQAREMEGHARVQALEAHRQAMGVERQLQLARTQQELARLEFRLRDLPEAERTEETARLQREQEMLRANERRLQEEARHLGEDSRRMGEEQQRVMQERIRREAEGFRTQQEQLRREQEVLRRAVEAEARAARSSSLLADRQGRHADLYAFSFRVRREMEVDGLTESGAQIHITQSGAGRYKVNGKKIPASLREKYEKLLAPYDTLIQEQGTVTLDARKGLMPGH